MAAISIHGLQVSFGVCRAVAGLDLEIPQGSLYGLLGPNGAGKTTAISCIAGLRRADEGRIQVGDVDVGAHPERVKEEVGLVPQSIALYGELSVLDNLRVFAGLFGLGRARSRSRIEWALGVAQLEEKRDARVDTLSGGMQRRLNLVTSLLHDPPTIICDEPTTGVDPQSRNHLFETIRELHAAGRTIVYTSHYMEEVEALCERVAIMDEGRVLREDSLEALTGDGRNLEQVFLDLTGRGLRDAS